MTPRDAQVLQPAGWRRPAGYAKGVAVDGRLVFVAGQIGWDPVTEQFPGTSLASQTAQAFRNIVAVLAEAGAEPRHLVRLTWFVTDRQAYIDARKELGLSYREILGRYYPAMSVIFVSGLLDAGAVVEIEATAVVPPG